MRPHLWSKTQLKTILVWAEASRREGACLQSTGPLPLSLVESLEQDPSLPSCLYSAHRGNDSKSHGGGGGSLVPNGEALVILRPQCLLILACVLRSLWKLTDEHDELNAPSSFLARGFHFKQSHVPPHGVSLQLSKVGVHVFSLGCSLCMQTHTHTTYKHTYIHAHVCVHTCTYQAPCGFTSLQLQLILFWYSDE